MRVNVYAEEMTDRIEIISKEIEGQTFTGLRIYLELPNTISFPNTTTEDVKRAGLALSGDQVQDTLSGIALIHRRGPFIHRPGDDDSSAVTFWGKRDMRDVLRKALDALDTHYAAMPSRELPEGTKFPE